jgi:hypothetical protein
VTGDSPRPLGSIWSQRNIGAIRYGLDYHNATCEHPAESILLHPYDQGLLRLDSLWGVPVVADESVNTKSFRVHCAAPRPDLDGELHDAN